MFSIIRKYLVYLFFLCLPLTGVLAINDNLNLPLLIGLILLILSLKVFTINISTDLLFLGFIVSMILSMFINSPISTSSYFYVIGYFLAFIIFYKVTILHYKDHRQKIIRLIYISTIILQLFIIYEFVTRNFFPDYFFDLPRVMVQYYDPLMLGKYIRARGFMEESGHTALFLEFSIPISIYYIIEHLKSTGKLIFFIVLVLLAQCMIYSAASLVIILVGLVLMMIIIMKNSMKVSSMFKILVFLCAFLLLSNIAIKIVPEIGVGYNQLVRKAFNINETTSSEDRSIRIEKGVALLKKYFAFGIGPMNFKYYILYEGEILEYNDIQYASLRKDSSLNIFIDIWLYSGILGFLLFMTWFITCFYKVFKINNSLKYYLFISLIMVFIHYQTVANFWYPWFWVLLGIIVGEARYEQADDDVLFLQYS